MNSIIMSSKYLCCIGGGGGKTGGVGMLFGLIFVHLVRLGSLCSWTL